MSWRLPFYIRSRPGRNRAAAVFARSRLNPSILLKFNSSLDGNQTFSSAISTYNLPKKRERGAFSHQLKKKCRGYRSQGYRMKGMLGTAGVAVEPRTGVLAVSLRGTSISKVAAFTEGCLAGTSCLYSDPLPPMHGHRLPCPLQLGFPLLRSKRSV